MTTVDTHEVDLAMKRPIRYLATDPNEFLAALFRRRSQIRIADLHAKVWSVLLCPGENGL
jgi:hypothetical protein